MEEYLKKVKVTKDIVSSLFDNIIFIEKVLSSIEVQYWWGTALELDNEDYKQLLNLRFGNNIPSKEEYIVSVQNKYKRLKSTLTGLSQRLSVDEMFIMESVSPASALYKLFNGKSRERYLEDDFRQHVLFDVLCDIRFFSFKIKENMFIGNESKRGVSMNEEFRKLIYYMLTSKEESKNGLSDISSNFIQKEKYDIIHDAFILLYTLLNMDLCGIDSQEVVDSIGTKPSNVVIQKWYDQYCAEHPGRTRDYEFADTIHSILKSEDFDWEAPKLPIYFNLPWNRIKIQHLYSRLIKDGYLDSRTDARNFCLFLTGHKPKRINQGLVFWCHKEIQTAALFLGEMKKRDTIKRGWNKLPSIMFIDDTGSIRPCEFSNISTQYSQAKGKDDYISLMKAIEEAENQVTNIKEEMESS